jgi:uncharacterized protein (DUF1800 family)
MALEAKAEAALALHRFGFGPRPGTISSIASDPRGAVLAELDQAGIGQIASTDLLTAAAANRAVYEFNAERLAKQRVAKATQEAAQKGGRRGGHGACHAGGRHCCRRCAQAEPDAAAWAAAFPEGG